MGRQDTYVASDLRTLYKVRLQTSNLSHFSHLIITDQFHTLCCLIYFSLNLCHINTEMYVNFVYSQCRKAYAFGIRSVYKLIQVYSKSLKGIDCLEYPCVHGKIRTVFRVWVV
jgi:hypothetical protein